MVHPNIFDKPEELRDWSNLALKYLCDHPNPGTALLKGQLPQSDQGLDEADLMRRFSAGMANLADLLLGQAALDLDLDRPEMRDLLANLI